MRFMHTAFKSIKKGTTQRLHLLRANLLPKICACAWEYEDLKRSKISFVSIKIKMERTWPSVLTGFTV